MVPGVYYLIGMSIEKRRRGWLPVLLIAAVLQGVFVSYRVPAEAAAPGMLTEDHPLDSPRAWSESVHAHFAEALFKRASDDAALADQ